MARKPQVSVEPRPDGRWAVQTDNTRRAYRLADRKADAVQIAIETSKRRGAELTIKDERGRIQEKNSYGHDPRDIPG
jgi:hypothetical protein